MDGGGPPAPASSVPSSTEAEGWAALRRARPASTQQPQQPKRQPAAPRQPVQRHAHQQGACSDTKQAVLSGTGTAARAMPSWLTRAYSQASTRVRRGFARGSGRQGTRHGGRRRRQGPAGGGAAAGSGARGGAAAGQHRALGGCGWPRVRQAGAWGHVGHADGNNTVCSR